MESTSHRRDSERTTTMSHHAKKRTQGEETLSPKKRNPAEDEDEVDESMLVDDNGLVFEDPFCDEFEEEIIEDNEEDDEDDEDEDDDPENAELRAQKHAVKEEKMRQKESAAQSVPKQVWRPGIDKLPEGEELEYDPSAYVMYHSLRTEWPCLSFDVLRDTLGDNRQRFPQTMFLVTGSQADKADKNKVTLLKLSDLHKTYVADSDEESDAEDDDNLDEDPVIEHVNVNHVGGVNRIRSMGQQPGLLATMADTSHVHIYDLSHVVKSMSVAGPRAAAPTKPLFSFTGHREEGYALDWSPVTAGRLATGDCTGKIHIWNPTSAGATSWQVDANAAYHGHTDSVEDLQWSPSEATVFASCSADRSVRIWDVRDRSKSQIAFDAHAEDVNVISWNRNVGYLLASGSDDGSFKVWDLRAVRKGCTPLAHFTYHKGAVTSIEWAPHDESMLAVSSEDNQISVWDLSVEADEEDATAKDPALADYPPQLLFLHLGQSNIKELHFHPQIPGTIVSTAEDSFNVFKPAITVSA